MSFDFDTLYYFGWAVILIMPIFILVNFLAGTHHLLTTRNALLGGAIPFVGSSAVACATTQDPYAIYGSEDIGAFIVCISLFLLVFLISYQVYKPETKPQKFLVDWLGAKPKYSRAQPIVFSLISLSFMAFAFYLANKIYIPFISELLIRIAPSGAIFATIFAFGVWMRDRSNPVLLILFVGLGSLCAVYAVFSGGGRRILLGVLGGLAVYYYWNDLVSKSRIKTTIFIGVFFSIVFAVMFAYSGLRHFDRGKNSSERTMMRSAEALMKIPDRLLHINVSDASENFHNIIGQNAVNCSLLCIYLSRKQRGPLSAELDFPQYFHTLKFVASNPIPRRLWSFLSTRSSKPVTLGYALPQFYNPYFTVNWGPGIVGHCYYEGGLWMGAVYGFLFGIVFKTLDVLLIKQKENLFVLGFIASSIPHIFMLTRGDNGIVILNIVFAFLFFLLMRWVGFRLYGHTRRKQSISIISPNPSLNL